MSGDAETTDYYENYPGIYELQSDSFNGNVTYKQVLGQDEAGNNIYGQGTGGKKNSGRGRVE